MSKKIIKAEELHITDAEGNSRLIIFIENGFPSIKLQNPNPEFPSAVLELDSKGTHIKFTHPKGNSSYFFLNNEGSSGLVMINEKGERSYENIVNDKG